MSAIHGEILTREEMTALLESLEVSRKEDEGRSRFLADGSSGGPAADAKLKNAFEQGVESYGRDLSARFQSRIRCTTLRWDELEMGDLEDLTMPNERVVLFDVEGAAAPAALIASRSLFFAWLTLTLGSRPGQPVETMGTRPYTIIEEKLLARFASEFVAEVLKAAQTEVRSEHTFRVVEEARALRDWADARIAMIHVEVIGLGELSRLRLAWPLEAAGTTGDRAHDPESTHGPRIRAELLDTRMALRVEAGSTEISVAKLSTLQPGDVLPLEVHEKGMLKVCVEGRHKFDGVRGSTGQQVAVQILRCVPSTGGEIGE